MQGSDPRLPALRRVWDLRRDDCPCDIDFVDWFETRGASGEALFHFGTGGHHYVGARLGHGDLMASVMGITATPGEYETYIELVTSNPQLARRYVVYFGDIYSTNPALLPTFDVVTLFHLCEFRTAANDAYGGLTDAELLAVLSDRTRPGGHILFYTGSYAYAEARPIIEAWSETGAVKEVEGFRSLRIFRKQPAPADAST